MEQRTICVASRRCITARNVDAIQTTQRLSPRQGALARICIALLLVLGVSSLLHAAQTAPPAPITPLSGVTEIQILPTVVKNPDKVKDRNAPTAVEKALRRAILVNEFRIVDAAPVRARIALDEFTGGSTATRFIVGFGAGRSTVDCRIQLMDQNEKEIASTRVRVRGDITWSPYEGNATQTKQAVNKFERALMDEIDKWRGPRIEKIP